MTGPNVSINLSPDASYEASGPPFGVSFFLENDSIDHITLFETSHFICNIFGKSSLQHEIFAWIHAYLEKTPLPHLPLDFTKFSPFTRIGLKTIQKIPFGQTTSYKDVACLAGNPKAARAIGNVCNRNPFPLVIPCHRVVGANQTLGGFAYSLDLKKSILDFESSPQYM